MSTGKGLIRRFATHGLALLHGSRTHTRTPWRVFRDATVAHDWDEGHALGSFGNAREAEVWLDGFLAGREDEDGDVPCGQDVSTCGRCGTEYEETPQNTGDCPKCYPGFHVPAART